MGEDRFKPSAEFMKAYDCTLRKAVNSLYYESDFRCQSMYPVRISLACKECPFQHSSEQYMFATRKSPVRKWEF